MWQRSGQPAHGQQDVPQHAVTRCSDYFASDKNMHRPIRVRTKHKFNKKAVKGVSGWVTWYSVASAKWTSTVGTLHALLDLAHTSECQTSTLARRISQALNLRLQPCYAPIGLSWFIMICLPSVPPCRSRASKWRKRLKYSWEHLEIYIYI